MGLWEERYPVSDENYLKKYSKARDFLEQVGFDPLRLSSLDVIYLYDVLSCPATAKNIISKLKLKAFW